MDSIDRSRSLNSRRLTPKAVDFELKIHNEGALGAVNNSNCRAGLDYSDYPVYSEYICY